MPTSHNFPPGDPNHLSVQEAQRRWSAIEDRVLRTFLEEMGRTPLDSPDSEAEWQFIALRCAQRLLKSAEASLHARVLKARLG